MFLPDCLTREVDDFTGPWLLPEATDVPLPKGLLARNVQYQPGNVGTRLGHSAVFTDTAATAGFTTLMNWLFSHSGPQNFLVGYSPGLGLRAINLLNSNAIQTVAIYPGAAGVCAVNAGQRCYITPYNSAAQGVIGEVAAVFDYATATTGVLADSDQLFAAPLTSVPTITETGTGNTTAGLHRFGFLMTTRYGFTTQWSPVNGATKFVPVGFTSVGGTILTFTVSGPAGGIWPSAVASIQPIMTTAANPNEYYAVVGSITAVPGGTTATLTITISINDGDLAASGDPVTKYESLLTLDINNIPPFTPSFMFVYANRMAYVTIDSAGFPVVYFSEPDNYQTITADQHGVYMPGNLQVITGQPIHGVCYLFGPHWTFAVSDNGQVPVEWARPQLVDGSIGTLSPYGVCINASQNFAWVADTAGLYLFQGGVFPAKPVSYYQTPDWKRINWNAATAVKVVDDKDGHRVCVVAPLDSATTPSHILTWDYTQGTDAESVAYSLDNLNGYSIGTVEMVENPANRNVERWLAPSTASEPIVRPSTSSDSHPYRDVAAAIDSVYQTALFPGQDGQRGGMHQFHAAITRAKGAGNLALTPYSLDGVEMASPFQISLWNAPGRIFRNRFYLVNEALSLLLEMAGQMDGYFQLSSMVVAYTMWSPLR